MQKSLDKETTGAWIIHHGRKVVLDTRGPAEFSAIDQAAKAATLLTFLGAGTQAEIPKNEVWAIAVASGLNPRTELPSLLQLLEKKRLIDQSGIEISVLGITTRGSLTHAADIFNEAKPSQNEQASLTLAEIASQAPIRRSDISEKIGDQHQMTKLQVGDFLNRAEEVGFVDKEGEGEDKLFFNGNLFRRGSVAKTQKILSSLTEADQKRVIEADDLLKKTGCLRVDSAEKILSKGLFDKLVAACVYDLNQVRNEQGIHVFVTLPSAFHKFVDPMVDDCFDMAKALVAALTYGMNSRESSRGKITNLQALLNNLISGSEVGPTTSIGEDYRVLEMNRVVKLRPNTTYPNRFHMRLLKREVGELALQVLTQGSADATSLMDLPGASMSGYIGPEESRTDLRKNQSAMSKHATKDVLEAIRGGRPF